MKNIKLMMGIGLVLFVQGFVFSDKAIVHFLSEKNIELGKEVTWYNNLGYVGYKQIPGSFEIFASMYRHLNIGVGISDKHLSPAATCTLDPFGAGLSARIKGLGLSSNFMISTPATLVVVAMAYAGYNFYKDKKKAENITTSEVVA